MRRIASSGVGKTVKVDEVPMPIADVFKSQNCHPLLSDEGVMTSPRIPGVDP